MQHAQNSGGVTIRKRCVTHIDARDLGGERQDIAGLDTVHDFGNPRSGHYIAWMIIEASLHLADLAEHAVICKGRVARSMLCHEAKRPRVVHTPKLRSDVMNEPALLAV